MVIALRPLSLLVLALTLAVCSSAGATTPTPTPVPTVNECSPSVPDCVVGTECYCCCGAFRCLPPGAPCCAIPCVSPTPTPTCPPLPPFQCLPDYETVCESIGGCTICSCVLRATPTPTPTAGGECNPLVNNCPSGTTCGCCCGAWECLNGTEICCEIACVLPTPPPTPTPTPIPGECGNVCDGRSCTVLFVHTGTCQPNGDQCLCVPNTPAPGDCALACDGRPCVGQCPDGSTASGICTQMTVDTGCACALECSTPTPTPTPPPGECVGDCSGDSTVTIDELILLVNIALGNAPMTACPGDDQWACNEGGIEVVTCIIEAVNNALYGCGTERTPTPIPTGTPNCGPCTSDADCPSTTLCNAAEVCLVSCQCPECAVCAGFCVPKVTPTPVVTPVLPHGHTCCECGDSACTDFSWVEVGRLCPDGCQTFPDAECEAPCHGGPQSGPAVCVSLTPCNSDADCDDGNGCTADHCTIDGCVHECLCV